MSAPRQTCGEKSPGQPLAPSHSELNSHSHSELSSHSHSEPNSHSHSEPNSHSHSEAEPHSHSHSLFHSHSHSHAPNQLLTQGSLSNPAVRITWIGLAVNVVMAASKAAGGVVFHSQALMADAIHSVLDMVADFLTLATVNVASNRGSAERFPLGYGKIESVGTMLVSGVLLFAGFTVGWSSLLLIFEFLLPAHIYDYLLVLQVHSHSHAHLDVPAEDHTHSHALAAVPNINAAWLALASIGVKEVLFRKTMNVATQTNSKVLVANAWHHRVDSLTAGVAFLTVTGGHVFGVSWLDAVGGLFVSVLIVNAGWSTFRDSVLEVLDRGVPQSAPLFVKVKLMVDEELLVAALAAGALDVALADLSVLPAGARTTLLLKLEAHQNHTLSRLKDLETRLNAGLLNRDSYLGKVLIEYVLKNSDLDSK